jgi:hypothetical protein
VNLVISRVQWRVWPPLAVTTASYLQRIEPLNRWIKACGMLFHSSTSASRSSCGVSGWFLWWITRLPSSRNFDHVFQHDNVICHVARVCHYFLNQNHIRVLPLSALSPDPNEHLWDELGRRVIHHLNIIIRTNHGQTEIVMQYGSLRSSVTCVTTSCSNDSFVSPTHRTTQSLDKGLWDLIN